MEITSIGESQSGNQLKWTKLLSTKRLRLEGPGSEDMVSGYRTPYESDVDRIVFSGAFRRLGRKTQVHPLAANDYIHTRLTHSIEVAQVGRALGKSLASQIREDLPDGIEADDLSCIVQAACLAHDIGNPPFGHAGEEAMSHWFELNGHRL